MAKDLSSGGSLVLVGCGKMGTAMLRGWRAAEAMSHYAVVEPAGLPAGLHSAKEISRHSTPQELPTELEPEAIVFAVKPQIADEVVANYRRWASPGTLFVSIIAGKTLTGLTRRLGEAAIVRTMPNTPAAIGRGITVACANSLVTAGQKRLCDRLLAAIGESAWIEDEALMDAVTAISGSGPAYVFLLIEALAEAGRAEGLPADLALRLARDTVAGSGELARLSSEGPAQLRENVTSPGGTTRIALDVLMAANGLGTLIRRAVSAATARSRELAS